MSSKRFRHKGGSNSPRASGMQVLGGVIVSYVKKEMIDGKDTFKDSPYMGPVLLAAGGHVAKKYNANVGAGICGGAGVLLHQAYEAEQQKKNAPAAGMQDAQGYQPAYDARGIYEPVR